MKSIFNLSAITIFSSLFIGLFNNTNSNEADLTDVDIYQLIDHDLEKQYAQIANVDMINKTKSVKNYLMADFTVQMESAPWYDNNNELIGVSISGSGTGIDQNLNEVSTAFVTKVDFESGKKWGSQIILSPDNYSVKYRHAASQDIESNMASSSNVNQAFFAGMNSIETRGELEGQGSSAIRYGAYNKTISNYTQLLSQEQIEGTISVHAYIN